MRKVATLLVFVCLFALLPVAARANSNSYNFPGCGTVVNRNASHQYGPGAWLEYIVETQGVFDICGQWVVTVAADVSGVPNSGLTVDAILYAVARRQVPVPNWGTWQTNGHHWAATSVPFLILHTGETVSYADILPTRQTTREQMCYDMGGSWTGWSCIVPNCPIVIDTAGDGYKLTSVEDGVLFDLDADGTPERVAWTLTGSDDGFLAIDRNGNGRIDDGAELFGNHARVYLSGSDVTAANGFEVLKFFDSLANNVSRIPDGAVDVRDAVFSRLLLWRDLNHNGISEPEELTRVVDNGIVAIATDYKTTGKSDRFGNEFRQMGRVTWAGGAVTKVYDVWLQAGN
jgi:hypothetical protein